MDLTKSYIKSYKKEKRREFWLPIFRGIGLILIAIVIVAVIVRLYCDIMVSYYDMIGLPNTMRMF